MTIRKLVPGQAGLPVPNPSDSYWLRDPEPELLGHRTTEELPDEVDVVVVGSGITGAFAARFLLEGGKEVLLLEAREAGWGATGRVSFFLLFISFISLSWCSLRHFVPLSVPNLLLPSCFSHHNIAFSPLFTSPIPHGMCLFSGG